MKFVPNDAFDSSKEKSWGTEQNAKKHWSLPTTVTEKSRKTYKNANFPQERQFLGHFGGYS